MDRREQDREIRKFMDQQVMAAAYGGMRFRTDTPVNTPLGTAPEKVTLYDTAMPRNGDPLGITFDQAASEIVIDQGQGGIYEAAVYFNFTGQGGGVDYFVTLYLDGIAAGDPVDFKVPGGGNTLSLQLSTQARLSGGQRWSVWINAEAAGSRFEVLQCSLFLNRISGILPDVPFTRTGYWL